MEAMTVDATDAGPSDGELDDTLRGLLVGPSRVGIMELLRRVRTAHPGIPMERVAASLSRIAAVTLPGAKWYRIGGHLIEVLDGEPTGRWVLLSPVQELVIAGRQALCAIPWPPIQRAADWAYERLRTRMRLVYRLTIKR